VTHGRQGVGKAVSCEVSLSLRSIGSLEDQTKLKRKAQEPPKHKHKLVGRMLPWGLLGLTAVQYSLSYTLKGKAASPSVLHKLPAVPASKPATRGTPVSEPVPNTLMVLIGNL
jgi:hypothetical protein